MLISFHIFFRYCLKNYVSLTEDLEISEESAAIWIIGKLVFGAIVLNLSRLRCITIISVLAMYF